MPDIELTSAELEEALTELEMHQTQLDMDGVMVGVSRQALDMVITGARAGLEARKAEESMRERAALPDDLFSHKRAWRDGLVTAKHNAPLAREDEDDAAYWQHEIDVFDRVFAELDAIRALPLTGDKP